MRQSLAIFCVSLSLHALAQWDYRPLAPDPSARRAQTAELPAIDLPFWDDFSYSGTAPDSLWEFSENVFINESLSINPPTYKAATFDGVTADGQVYDPDDQFPGLTDQLVSRRVRLASLIDDEEIYLSFFWQMGGNGEAPEASGDSLRLQFLNADSVWVTVWKRQATQVSDTETFTQSILKVEPTFRHDDFRFKFEAFGSLQGPFDTWHVDYVYLNNGRSAGDLFYDDQALVSVTSLIAPYREMPAEHFFSNTAKYVVPQLITAINLNDINSETLQIDCEIEIQGPDDTLLESVSFVNVRTFSDPQTHQTETLDADTGTDGIQPVTFSTTLPVPDSVRIDVEINSNFTDLYRINDTIRVSYQLQKHYAYDDGVAEFAAGVRQNGTIAALLSQKVQR